VLFDHNVPERLRRQFASHEIRMTRDMGEAEIGNGVLLRAAAEEGFGAFLTIDRTDSSLLTLMELLERPLVNSLDVVQKSGEVLVLTQPHERRR
jgi:hypothetical protein